MAFAGFDQLSRHQSSSPGLNLLGNDQCFDIEDLDIDQNQDMDMVVDTGRHSIDIDTRPAYSAYIHVHTRMSRLVHMRRAHHSICTHHCLQKYPSVI